MYRYNFAAGRFHRKKHCSRIFRKKLNFTGKNSKIAFCAIFWGDLRSKSPKGGTKRFRGNVHDSSKARWKARGRLTISANRTFSPALAVEAL